MQNLNANNLKSYTYSQTAKRIVANCTLFGTA